MPNIKSSKKSMVTEAQANERNVAKKSRIKTETKKYRKAIAEQNVELAEKLLPDLISLIDRAKSDKVYHPSTASRKVSRLSKELSDLKASLA